MAQKRSLLIVLIAIVMAVSVQQALGLKCWRCDSVQYPNCGDPFTAEKLTDLNIECQPNQSGKEPANSPAVCLKARTPNGIIYRQCANSEDDAKKVCKDKAGGAADFCETCNEDSCNTASQYGPVMLLIAIPVAILMKISSF